MIGEKLVLKKQQLGW